MSDRVPPHDLVAEESLLGAMLLSVDGRRPALDTVDGEDFYTPGHRTIFMAIERLHHRGDGVDLTTVASELGADLEGVGGRAALARLHAGTPLSANAAHYARIVADAAYLRRGIAAAGDLAELGYLGDVDRFESFVGDLPARLAAPTSGEGLTEGLIDVGDLVRSERKPKVMVIPGLLGERERVGLSADEGVGKSTLLRQMNVMVASGIHPFTWEPITAARGLHVDMENEAEDSDFEGGTGYFDLVGKTGSRYQGGAMRRVRTQGIDLRAKRDVRWLEAQIKAARPAILYIGPVYKMYRGQQGSGKFSDEAVDEVIGALDELRVRYNLALIIEGHSPYGSDGDRAGGRWKGSQLWSAWLDFARTLRLPEEPDRPKNGTDVDVVPWRFDRHEGRRWPTRLVHGKSWPWEVPNMTAPVLDLGLEEPF